MRNIAVAHIQPGDEITIATGRLLPSGIVASREHHIGTYPARDVLRSPDSRLAHTNAARVADAAVPGRDEQGCE